MKETSNLHTTDRRPHSLRRREHTFLRTSHSFSSCWRLNGFCVTTEHVEVCPVSRGIMLPCGATPIRPVAGRPSLLPQSSADRSDRVACASPACLTSGRRNDRFTAFNVKHMTGLVLFYPPAAHLVPVTGLGSRSTRCIPFWVRPPASWACLGSRGFRRITYVGQYQSVSPQATSMLAATADLHRSCGPLREGHFVPLASHGSVTRAACNGRLREREFPVPLLQNEGGTMLHDAFASHAISCCSS